MHPYWKVRYRIRPPYVACRLYVGAGRNWELCGDFQVKLEEFDSLRIAFDGASFEED